MSVRFERSEHVGVLTLDAPPANAFSRALVDGLEGLLAELATDAELRVLIVTGAGTKAFCAGADLKERAAMTPEEVRAFVPRLQALTRTLAELPMPTIAAINGVAFGGGLELALACDVRIAATTANVGLTETSLAIIPGAGGTVRLSRLVGSGRAKELIFAARRMDAAEAARRGLVEDVVEPDALMTRAHELADAIAANGPLAVRAAKRAIDAGLGVSLSEALDAEAAAYASIVDTADRLEGLAAFAQKRPPVYRGV